MALDMFVISNNVLTKHRGMFHVRPHRLIVVSAASDALARSDGVDEYSAAQRAELSRCLQGIVIIEPIIAKAARKLGVDQVAIRHINCPEGKAPFGPPVQGKLQYATSAFLKEALERGAEQFRWSERVARTPKRMGTKVRGIGVSLSCFVGGTIGFDGLLVIKPDGRITSNPELASRNGVRD